MKITADIALDKWERSIAKIYDVLQRKTMPEIINRSAGSICLNAYRFTPKAVTERIRAKYYGPGSKGPFLGRRVVVAKLLKRGQNVFKFSPGEIDELTKHWIEGRVKAIGFFRFGWIQAAIPFIPWMKKNLRIEKRAGGKRAIGIGDPATRRSWVAQATIENRAVLKHGDVRPALEAAATRAIYREAIMLERQAEKILQRDLAKKYS